MEVIPINVETQAAAIDPAKAKLYIFLWIEYIPPTIESIPIIARGIEASKNITPIIAGLFSPAAKNITPITNSANTPITQPAPLQMLNIPATTGLAVLSGRVPYCVDIGAPPNHLRIFLILKRNPPDYTLHPGGLCIS
jgi:hypothetical protein